MSVNTWARSNLWKGGNKYREVICNLSELRNGYRVEKTQPAEPRCRVAKQFNFFFSRYAILTCPKHLTATSDTPFL